MTAAVILRDDKSLRVTVNPQFIEAKEQALMEAAWVVGPIKAKTQERAVLAQARLHKLIALVEKDRKTVKEPVLEYGRAIDAAAKQAVGELEAEHLRLSIDIGTFQEQENAKTRAAQQAENERLSELERERAAFLAKATSEEEVERIQEQFNVRAQQEAISVAPPLRAEGQRVTEDWEVAVVDIWALARAHPMAVKIEARLSEIKTMLNAGQKVAGITAKRVTKSTIRTQNK